MYKTTIIIIYSSDKYDLIYLYAFNTNASIIGRQLVFSFFSSPLRAKFIILPLTAKVVCSRIIAYTGNYYLEQEITSYYSIFYY